MFSFLVSVLSFSLVPGLQAEKAPGMPQVFAGQPENGLAWELSMPVELSTADALPIAATLFNRSGGKLAFDMRGATAKPVILLSKVGKPQRALEVEARRGINETGNAYPEADEGATGFYGDLRQYSGRLAPGRYRLVVVLPSEAYRLPGFEGYAPRDIESPVVTFEVRQTTLALAKQAGGSRPAVSFSVDEAVADGDGRRVHKTVRLRHRLPVPIHFTAYVDGNEQVSERPLSALMTWERWLPPHGWVEVQGFGFCGTGLGDYSLEAGRERVLHAPWLPWDGIYRFVLNGNRGAGHDAPLRITSDVVLVDNFD